ncbi:MAG: 3-dehydroquinate synthase [Bacteroidetes bacterium]|nr:MAG: 3-dehydroquinate synthase [Bacteroidota bacterium]
MEIGTQALEKLALALQGGSYSQVMVLTDTHTTRDCYPHLRPFLPPDHVQVEVAPGERHKHLGTCQHIWQAMTEAALDRRALMVNLGGGVIGDMGGFVASTYKRGIRFIQVPTTLLSQVDASVGGKLGVDFHGYKNHIGLFAEPEGVYIWPPFLQTLPTAELRSGFAEVIKHHLIADASAWEALQQITDLSRPDYAALIRHSVDIKARIVAEDPYERGLRKALNFGHTVGHAVESERLETSEPLLHGEAIALGMMCEAWLSQQAGFLSEKDLEAITRYLAVLYGHTALTEAEIPAIVARTRNDKKNEGGRILCTLLDGPGQARVNQAISLQDVEASLRWYQGLGVPG